jgi:hypothetical protein
MAILIPVLHSAQEQGQRAVCMANLRQLHLAWWSYAEDHDGRVVPIWEQYPQPPSKDKKSWAHKLIWISNDYEYLVEEGFLWPYIKIRKTYSCPATPRNLRLDCGSNVCYRLSSGLRINHDLSHVADRYKFLEDIYKIKQPGQRMLFFDLGRSRGYCPEPYIGHQIINLPKECWAQYDYPPLHHNNGTCLNFVDGHNEYWKWEDPRTIKLGRERLRINEEQSGNQDMARLDRAIWGP